ncbi:hypothetical protein D1007_12730 [Hordeum vulgare]|nr:hypothetical protein D1007_12730 [Hordeum vulgare]
MDGRADIPLIPSYTHDPYVAAADGGANASGGSFGFTSAGAPPSTVLLRSLFMASQTTSAAGGVASTPVVKPRGPLPKLPNVTVAKAGKVSGKKNKPADSSCRRPKKRLAGRATDAAATKAPASSLVALAARACCGLARLLE